MLAPPITIAMSRPDWLLEHRFTIRQVADITDIPAGTLTYWSSVAALLGYDLVVKRHHRRLFTAHGVFIFAVLAALQRAGVTITSGVIGAVLGVAHKDGTPILPNLLDQLHLVETHVVTEVELSQIWLEVEAKLGTAHA